MNKEIIRKTKIEYEFSKMLSKKIKIDIKNLKLYNEVDRGL